LGIKHQGFWGQEKAHACSKVCAKLETQILASLYPAEKRPKTESSTTAFSSCDGSSGNGKTHESLEEKDVVQVELQGSELWKRFHDIGTEMIITKAGRFGSAQTFHESHVVGI
jgi:hypothetical protein